VKDLADFVLSLYSVIQARVWYFEKFAPV